MKRILRVGVLAFSLVGLLGFYAQPASASEIIEVEFQGHAQIGAGYSAFGFPVGDPSKTTLPGTQVKTAHGATHVNWTGFHNSTTVAFASAAAVGGCVAEKATTGKAKHTTGAGTCSIGASGTIHGYCGLSTGIMSGTLHTSMNSVVPPGGHVSQSYSFHIKFTVDGPDVSFTGHIFNHTSGQSGSITGTAASAILAGGGDSCTDKNPKSAPIAGHATGVT